MFSGLVPKRNSSTLPQQSCLSRLSMLRGVQRWCIPMRSIQTQAYDGVMRCADRGNGGHNDSGIVGIVKGGLQEYCRSLVDSGKDSYLKESKGRHSRPKPKRSMWATESGWRQHGDELDIIILAESKRQTVFDTEKLF